MSLSISDLISERARVWAGSERQSARSVAGAVLRRADEAGKLREPQVRAVEAYLWLKFVGQNRRLSDLVLSGVLADSRLAEKHGCPVPAYSPARQFLVAFAGENGGLRNLERAARSASEPDLADGLRKMLRDFSYPNYLFSLPMGAGKTWLMSAFACLDLHFSRMLPGDPRFARNFVVFAPHAQKTAILPSLKTMRDFDPEWILPPAAAAEVRGEMRVEILDSPRAGKNDTRVNNPNLEKVNRLARDDARGLVFVTNAEKVVLERPEAGGEYQARMGAREWAAVQKTNDLRERMADIPALAVFLDEVHHAYAGAGGGEKKLREAVNVLGRRGNLRAVLGFSGTPYVKSEETVCGVVVKTPRLPDVVCDYPLARGIGVFLKRPKVSGHDDARESSFIREALDKFFGEYDRQYGDGTKSKIAFYCPSVAALNEEILPVVRQWFAENRPGREGEIFSFYVSQGGGEKKYKLPDGARAEFHNLDSPQSERRVVLLVAVGKEGWDCRSLTAVALPRRGSAKNFVLQTTCRCLREVRNAADETAMVFLGDGNFRVLENELRESHNTTVAALEGGEADSAPVVVRKPRLGALKFKQVFRRLTVESRETIRDPAKRLRAFSFASVRRTRPYAALVVEAGIDGTGRLRRRAVRVPKSGGGEFPFAAESDRDFLMELSRALWGEYSAADLARAHGPRLREIRAEFAQNREWLAGHPDGGGAVCRDAVRRVAACFAAEEKWKSDVIDRDAEIQLLEWRNPAAAAIPWASGKFLPEIDRRDLSKLRRRPNRLEEELEDQDADPGDISFNYAPYRFASDFERAALREMLRDPALRDFELYYNGMVSGGLESFRIQTPAGLYTPDFLLLKRRDGRPRRKGAAAAAAIERVLVIETKGAVFADAEFRAKEKFVREAFLRYNPNFHYAVFVDEGGRNDFRAHLAELREQVQKWAAGEKPT